MKSKIRNIRFVKILITIVIATFSLGAIGQQIAKLKKSDSNVIITGTSTLHDWEEKVLQFDSQLQLVIKENELLKIENATFTGISKSVESGNSLMNSKTHEALKVTEHPDIKFTLKNIEKLSSTKGQFSALVTGELKIAGISKNISFPVSGTIQNTLLTVNGSKDIDMRDFSVVPPSVMLGTIKTGKDVKVSFSLVYQL